ncbi:MAG: AAA family ATPase [Candidatus Moraniibacteriota bacterium]
MKYIYSSIKLSSDALNNYFNSGEEKLESMDNLAKVNIFVGSNNSGKSRFLREIMKIDEYIFNATSIETEKFIDYINVVSNDVYKIKEQYGKDIMSFTIDGQGSFNDSDFIKTNFKYYDFSANFSGIKRLLNALDKRAYLIRVNSHRGSGDTSQLSQNLNNYFTSNREKIDFILNYEMKKIEFDKLYIPINRSLNSFEIAIDGRTVKERQDVRDFFKIRTQQIYGISDKVKIFTGQDLYFEIRDKLLGNQDHRKMIADYEKFLSVELFGNKEVSLIPKAGSDVLSIKIGEEEKRIYELGDGIQGLIMLTFQLFMVDNGLFFIEEPEINLHPGMQRKFLETILRNNGQLSKKNHQYFFTTHSNHFLDLTLDYGDISIYKFSSDNSSDKLLKIIENVSSGDERILNELGVKNSSVFLTNATIWVEGITDRLYIKKFIQLYQDYFNEKERISEDIDYSFVEYGGSNITHWSFLESNQPAICIDRLCGKSILVTDTDGKNKIERQKELKNKLGDRYICLSCREIENILSLNTLEKVIKKYPKEKKFVMPSFSDKHPHANEKIGEFIEKKLGVKNKYKDKSGSLLSSKKLDFCNKAIEDMTYEDMSNRARTLTEKIYDFILSQKT